MFKYDSLFVYSCDRGEEQFSIVCVKIALYSG